MTTFAGATRVLGFFWTPLLVLGGILTVWCVYFFRDPPRVTPTREGLVISPADDYVAEFTRNVTKAKVVRVSSLMKPLPRRAPSGGYGGDVSLALAVADAAPLFGEGGKALRVVGADGSPVGCLMRDDAVRVMMQG